MLECTLLGFFIALLWALGWLGVWAYALMSMGEAGMGEHFPN